MGNVRSSVRVRRSAHSRSLAGRRHLPLLIRFSLPPPRRRSGHVRAAAEEVIYEVFSREPLCTRFFRFRLSKRKLLYHSSYVSFTRFAEQPLQRL